MRLDPFQLERYFGQYEFSVEFPLAASDCDGLSLTELLSLCDGPTRDLWDELRLGYTESQGHPLLRQEIAGMYLGCEPDQVLVAAPEELIFIAANCLVRNGDHVVCTFPGYQSLYSVAEALHAEVSRWEPDEADGWRFDPERLAELIRPSTRLIVVNFPHNPTGSLPAFADFERILEIAASYGIPVFSDEMYRLLERDPGDRLPAAVELYDRAVSLSGVSKTLGLAGLRIGWLVVRDERLMRRLIALKDYTTICNSAPSEILALAGLRARESILARHHERIERNLGLLVGLHGQVRGALLVGAAPGRDDLLSALQARDAGHARVLSHGPRGGRRDAGAVDGLRLRRASPADRRGPRELPRRAPAPERLPHQPALRLDRRLPPGGRQRPSRRTFS